MSGIHAWRQPVRLSGVQLPENGDEQTAFTVSLMGKLAAIDAGSDAVQSVSRQLAAGNSIDYARNVYDFVRGTLRFKRDEELAQGIEGWGPVVEVLVRPVDMLSMEPAEGDCDDFSMLVASLLLAGGIDCSFACVGADPLEPDRFSHVYVLAHPAKGDISIDASHGPYFGWEAPNNLGKFESWRVAPMHAGLGTTAPLVPTFSTTVTAAAPSTDPAWLQIVNRGLDIVQGRFATPENTLYRTPDGTIVSRGSSTQAPVGAPIDIRATGSFAQQSDIFGSLGGLFIYGALAFFAFILLMRMTGKK